MSSSLDLARRRMLHFGVIAAAFFATIWALQFAFKDDGLPGTGALVAVLIVGLWWVRPGWNLVPRRIDGSMILLLAALGASAVLAAIVLVGFGIQTPYDRLQVDLMALMPMMAVFVGLEELLYRQIAYRWLEKGNLPERTTILATAAVWGYGHLGGAFAQAFEIFGLLQSLYLIWIGVLLGELRRMSGSWLVSWIGHLAYNVTFLFAFILINQ